MELKFKIGNFSYDNTRNEEAPAEAPPKAQEGANTTPQASYGDGNYFGNNGAYFAPFDGQNSLGEMGPPVRYTVDHGSLMIRSWQMYLESSNYKTIAKKLKDTVVGSGLKLQCNPKVSYLKKKRYQFG